MSFLFLLIPKQISYADVDWIHTASDMDLQTATCQLNDLYSSPNIVRVIKSRRMRWVGHVARMGEERGVYRVLVGKPEGRRPLGRPRRRWVDNIRMDLQDVDIWTGLGWSRIETVGGLL